MTQPQTVLEAVATAVGGPPQAVRSSAWMTPCGLPVRWCSAPTSPLSSLRSACSTSNADASRGAAGTTGGGAGAALIWADCRDASSVRTWSGRSRPGRPRKSSSSGEPGAAPVPYSPPS